MDTSCGRCSKVVAVIRILLGLAMLYFGGMKLLGASPEMMTMIGGAAHQVGLTFLSTTVWFWVATVAELLAGVMLVLGFRSRVAAVLVLIIMAFAINAVGPMRNAIAVAVAALIVLIKGSGAWAISHCGGCETGEGGCCGGVCHTDMPTKEAAPMQKMNEMK